jgi:hypothetical protein
MWVAVKPAINKNAKINFRMDKSRRLLSISFLLEKKRGRWRIVNNEGVKIFQIMKKLYLPHVRARDAGR